MKAEPAKIFAEYRDGVSFKAAMGTKGLYEQTRINERFFMGDQWHGAKCGNERPLVRHNIIKRIGDFKMAQVLSAPIAVTFGADGIPNTVGLTESVRAAKKRISANPDFRFEGDADVGEINTVLSALGDYQSATAERLGLNVLCERALRNAYISGSAVLYTYWDADIATGLYADRERKATIDGDIGCEVLDIENVYFGDPYLDTVQEQPFILLASRRSVASVRREAARFGGDTAELSRSGVGDSDGKILVLTRLFKEYKKNGTYTVRCVKVTENAVVRPEFDTRLRMYPVALFTWQKRNNRIYGESEITYLIPNQIAINRMITANVWSAMTMGMPMMVVNGDTVTDDLTNDPGQIIRIFGSNEDVAGAVRYVSPPDAGAIFGGSIESLINNTLTQSGANAVALGDSRPDNASALVTMRDAATMPLQLVRNRFYAFVEEVSRIWADFWITQYGSRRIKISDENGIWYMPFDAERYRELLITARVDVGADSSYSAAESISTLTGLYEKGILNKRQYLKRLPAGIVPDVSGLLQELTEETESGEESG